MLDSYIVLDLETTGLSSQFHKITEIGAVHVVNHKIVSEFSTLVNPGIHIPEFITHLTGINDEMVKEKRHIREILPELKDFLKNEIVIAHNATFDRGFLAHNFDKYLYYDFLNEFLCTRKLATRLLPNLTSRKLGSIAEHLCIKNENAHRAMSDVMTTVRIFEYFQEMLHEKGIRTNEDILKFQNIPKRKICF